MASNLISVVDDDESVRRTTKLLIESFGYRAAVYESAEVLLRSRKLHDTLCLIVDVQMPGIGGLELQNQLAAKGYSIPIIFIIIGLTERNISSPSNASWGCSVPRQAF